MWELKDANVLGLEKAKKKGKKGWPSLLVVPFV